MTGDTWKLILNEIAKISNNANRTVNPPATMREIDHLETSLGVSLPGGFKEYLLTFNGQRIEDDKLDPVPLVGFIWNRKWIPFSVFAGSQRLVIDLDPGVNTAEEA